VIEIVLSLDLWEMVIDICLMLEIHIGLMIEIGLSVDLWEIVIDICLIIEIDFSFDFSNEYFLLEIEIIAMGVDSSKVEVDFVRK
jgi:hypothetical protein